MPFEKANGVDLYYELTGDKGDPMVLIHGSWGDHTNWEAVVPGLAQSFRVLTYDRRGHSKSGKVATPGSFDEDAMDASALLHNLGLEPAHVVGNSGGAAIALKLACVRHSVFRSLIVHEPPLLDLAPGDPSTAPMLREGRIRVEAAVRVLESGDRAGGARKFVETIAFGAGAWDKLTPQLRETFITNADTWLDETRDPQGLLVDLEGLSRFPKPVCFSYGGKSAPFFRPIVEKLAGVIPGSRLEAYPADGHTPHISNPDEFVRRVAAFARSSS